MHFEHKKSVTMFKNHLDFDSINILYEIRHKKRNISARNKAVENFKLFSIPLQFWKTTYIRHISTSFNRIPTQWVDKLVTCFVIVDIHSNSPQNRLVPTLQSNNLTYLQLMCCKNNGFIPKGSFNTVLENVLSNMRVNCTQWII